MTITELIRKLEDAKEEHGDLPVVSESQGCLGHDIVVHPLSQFPYDWEGKIWDSADQVPHVYVGC